MMSNYRPVSLTSHFGKILEAIIKNNIFYHLTVYTLINDNDSQHRFFFAKKGLAVLIYRSF